MGKQEEITKLMFVEDGSVDVNDIIYKIDLHHLPIVVITYRQGAMPPQLIDITNKENK